MTPFQFAGHLFVQSLLLFCAFRITVGVARVALGSDPRHRAILGEYDAGFLVFSGLFDVLMYSSIAGSIIHAQFHKLL